MPDELRMASRRPQRPQESTQIGSKSNNHVFSEGFRAIVALTPCRASERTKTVLNRLRAFLSEPPRPAKTGAGAAAAPVRFPPRLFGVEAMPAPLLRG
eukprot:7418344-Pyramimonas_sp.AAC.1